MSTILSAELDYRRELAFKFLRHNYDRIHICPYCGDGPKDPHGGRGCCGESSAHFEEVYLDDDGEIIDLDWYVENFDPIKEQIAFNHIMDANLARRGLCNLRLV